MQSNYSWFYKSKRWERIRDAVLARDRYSCQESIRYGIRATASHVHHIVPLKVCLACDPEIAYSPYNLISLSRGRHDEMHDRTNGKLTAKGVELIRRKFGVEVEQFINFVAEY